MSGTQAVITFIVMILSAGITYAGRRLEKKMDDQSHLLGKMAMPQTFIVQRDGREWTFGSWLEATEFEKQLKEVEEIVEPLLDASLIQADTITADTFYSPRPGDEVEHIRNAQGHIVKTATTRAPQPPAPDRRAWYASRMPEPAQQAPHKPLSLIEWAKKWSNQ